MDEKNFMHQLRYHFLTLPVGIQIQLVQDLGLFREEDRGILDPELFRRVIQRASDQDKLSELWDKVQFQHKCQK